MAVKNLFTKHDHRPVMEITKEQAAQAASWFWRFNNFGVSFTSPYSMQGSQFYSKLGLRQSVAVNIIDEGQNVGVDLNVSAELTDEGAVVGIVGLLVLPVTLAVGAVSYLEYENDAQRLMEEFWRYLYAFPKNPVPPAGTPHVPSWAQGQPAPQAAAAQSAAPLAGIPRACPKCGAQVDSSDTFCRKCGTRL